MDKINEAINSIKPLDERAMTEAKMRQNNLTKPRGLFGST